ncbi:MAG: hypothetical protein NVSMB9_34070 [Isosphaeraceae bacterium]
MERFTRFVLGPLSILCGLWFIALPFAFARMAFGGREAPPGWGEFLQEVFRGGVSSISLGLLMVLGGAYLAATRASSDEPREGPGRT